MEPKGNRSNRSTILQGSQVKHEYCTARIPGVIGQTGAPYCRDPRCQGSNRSTTYCGEPGGHRSNRSIILLLRGSQDTGQQPITIPQLGKRLDMFWQKEKQHGFNITLNANQHLFESELSTHTGQSQHLKHSWRHSGAHMGHVVGKGGMG